MPGMQKTKKWLLEYTKNSEEYNNRLRHIQIAWFQPEANVILEKARLRAAYKNEPTPQGWLQKFISSDTSFKPKGLNHEDDDE